METNKSFQRAPAVPLPLSELMEAAFIQGNKEKASAVITKSGMLASRLKVWGVIVRKFVNEESSFGVLELDDFSGITGLNFFERNWALMNDFEVGNEVSAMGKVRKNQNGEIVLIPEIIQKISWKEEILQRLENVKSFKESKKLSGKEKEELLKEAEEKNPVAKGKFLENEDIEELAQKEVQVVEQRIPEKEVNEAEEITEKETEIEQNYIE